MPIVRSVAVLRDPPATPGLVAVAVVALAEGVQQQLPVPRDAALLLWHAVRRSAKAPWCSLATAAIGEIGDGEVVALVLEAVLDANVGAGLADAALDILSGSAVAPLVTDRDLLAIAERAGGRLVRGAANVVRAVCEARRVPHEVVEAIANGWSRRRDLGARLVVLELVDLLHQTQAQRLVDAALADEHSGVRSAAALRIADVFDADAGLGLVERSLTAETHNVVVGDLLSARAELRTTSSV